MSINNTNPKGYIELDPSLKIAECPCKSKEYRVIVEPRFKDGTARINSLICVSCGHMVVIEGDAIIGEKKKIYTDSIGKRHFQLNAEAGEFN